MFKKLINKSKATEEEFLKELLNPNTTNEKLDKMHNELDLNLNELNINNEHILHYCCKKDLFQSVIWLISKGINLEIQNSQEETAIFYAIHAKNSAILQVLIDNKVNINHLNILIVGVLLVGGGTSYFFCIDERNNIVGNSCLWRKIVDLTVIVATYIRK